MGERNLFIEDEETPAFANGAKHPGFFVVDDIYNLHDKVSVVECNIGLVSLDLIRQAVRTASQFPGWRIVMNMGDCGLRIYGDRILVGGRRFWDCSTIEEVASKCPGPVDYGEYLPADSMCCFWKDLVLGRVEQISNYPTPPNREWQELITIVKAMMQQNSGKTLSGPSYQRIRYDLHPDLRREFTERLLADAHLLSPSEYRTGARNIRDSISDALVSAGMPEQQKRFSELVSKAQTDSALTAEEVLFWWPYVIDNIKNMNASLRGILIEELVKQLHSCNQWVQLSAVFSLARLRAPNIEGIVDGALRLNSNWLGNDKLTKWLLELRNGWARYPSGLQLE